MSLFFSPFPLSSLVCTAHPILCVYSLLFGCPSSQLLSSSYCLCASVGVGVFLPLFLSSLDVTPSRWCVELCGAQITLCVCVRALMRFFFFCLLFLFAFLYCSPFQSLLCLFPLISLSPRCAKPLTLSVCSFGCCCFPPSNLASPAVLYGCPFLFCVASVAFFLSRFVSVLRCRLMRYTTLTWTRVPRTRTC